jgi:hypothetical protein
MVGGGNLVVEALCYIPQVLDPMSSLNFSSIFLILPATPGPEVYSTPNRNEYQKHKNVSVD